MNAKIDFLIATKRFDEPTKIKWLKILTPKQIFQILPITLVQEKAVNNSENLLNEIT